jgi:hypothetical protein
LGGQKEKDGKGNNTKREEDKDMEEIKERKNLFYVIFDGPLASTKTT